LGTAIGAGIGFVSSIVSQKIAGNEEINWSSVWIATAQGAIIGTLPAATPLILGAGVSAGVGFIADVADQKIAQKKNWNEIKWRKSILNGAISGTSYGVAGKLKCKLQSRANKGPNLTKLIFGATMARYKTRGLISRFFIKYHGAASTLFDATWDIGVASVKSLIESQIEVEMTEDKSGGIWIT